MAELWDVYDIDRKVTGKLVKNENVKMALKCIK